MLPLMTLGVARSADREPVHVAFRSGKVAGDWQARHARGEVPGAWPYGLEGLERALSASLSYTSPPSRLQRARGRLLPRMFPRGEHVVTWDEITAYDVSLTRRPRRLTSGVIWLTDQLARGRPVDGMLRVLRRADALWVLSRAQIEPLERALGSSAPPVSFLRFGIDPTFFAAQKWPERPRIVSVGGDRDRDTATLYAALERVHDARPDVELVVQTASDLAPPAGVTTFAHLPHVALRDLYGTATTVAIATRPNLHVSGMTVSLEAMSTGRPVVITDSPGMDDYVADGVVGHVTPHGDAAALADALIALVDDPDRARAMGAAAAARVRSDHTADAMSERIASIARTGR